MKGSWDPYGHRAGRVLRLVRKRGLADVQGGREAQPVEAGVLLPLAEQSLVSTVYRGVREDKARRVTSYKLQVIGCKLHVASDELCATRYKLHGVGAAVA